MLPQHISKYDELSKIITCSNSFGDQPMSTLIAQEDVEDLYRIECKVLNYIDDNYDEEGKTEFQTLEVKEKNKLLSAKTETLKQLELEQEIEMLKLENEKLKLKLDRGNSTTCTRVNFRLDFLFVAKRFIISYIV